MWNRIEAENIRYTRSSILFHPAVSLFASVFFSSFHFNIAFIEINCFFQYSSKFYRSVFISNLTTNEMIFYMNMLLFSPPNILWSSLFCLYIVELYLGIFRTFWVSISAISLSHIFLMTFHISSKPRTLNFFMNITSRSLIESYFEMTKSFTYLSFNAKFCTYVARSSKNNRKNLQIPELFRLKQKIQRKFIDGKEFCIFKGISPFSKYSNWKNIWKFKLSVAENHSKIKIGIVVRILHKMIFFGDLWKKNEYFHHRYCHIY